MSSNANFPVRIQTLKDELVAQGRRVQAMIEASFDAVFAKDPARAAGAVEMDTEIDRVDVAVEKSAVGTLVDACKEGASLDERQLRMILTIVKINNELERIADEGVEIAGEVAVYRACASPCDLPPTFRVLANSVIGILRDSVNALDRVDPKLAKVVLMSESAVEQFKKQLVSDIQRRVHDRTMPLDVASAMHDTAFCCVNIADHCTNICEQVMYTATGTIVRHMEGKWEEVKL